MLSHSVVSDSFWPVDYRPPVFSVHGILQARILEWVAISFSRGSSRPRDQTWVSALEADALTSKPPGKPHTKQKRTQKVPLKLIQGAQEGSQIF